MKAHRAKRSLDIEVTPERFLRNSIVSMYRPGAAVGRDEGEEERRRRRKIALEEDNEEEIMELDLDDLADLKAGNLQEWLSLPAPQRALQLQFSNFLKSYLNEEGESYYGKQIQSIVESIPSFI